MIRVVITIETIALTKDEVKDLINDLYPEAVASFSSVVVGANRDQEPITSALFEFQSSANPDAGVN